MKKAKRSRTTAVAKDEGEGGSIDWSDTTPEYTDSIGGGRTCPPATSRLLYRPVSLTAYTKKTGIFR